MKSLFCNWHIFGPPDGVASLDPHPIYLSKARRRPLVVPSIPTVLTRFRFDFLHRPYPYRLFQATFFWKHSFKGAVLAAVQKAFRRSSIGCSNISTVGTLLDQ